MSLLNYLQLQTIDPQDDGTVSDLDEYPVDEVIDLVNDPDGATLVEEWDRIVRDLHE